VKCVSLVKNSLQREFCLDSISKYGHYRWDIFAEQIASIDDIAIARLCVDKPKGAKLASQFKGLLKSGIPKVGFLSSF